MQARVVITPDGKVSVFTEQGTFEQGKERIEKLLKTLGLEGVEFDEVGEVEQHRHDHEHAHAHKHVHE